VAGQHVQLEQDQQQPDQRERQDEAVREPTVDVRAEEQRERRRPDRAGDAVERLQSISRPEPDRQQDPTDLRARRDARDFSANV